VPRAVATAAVLFAAALIPAGLSAQKTDILVMRNGDRITGEIKELTRGKLDYSTDDAGRLSVEWEKVARLTSANVFEIEVTSGRKYQGWLKDAAADGWLVVEGAGSDTLRIPSVVEISTLNARFTQRLKAYLDVGFTFAKANQATTFSLAGEGDYRGPKLGASLAFDSYFQGQEETPTASRNSTQLTLRRFLPNRWAASVIAGAEQNSELDLALRFTGGGGGGRVLRQSNRADLTLGGGMVVTRERFTGSDSASADTTTTNLEGLVFFGWNAYRFDSPKLDLSTSFTAYPSLSQFGRLRGNVDIRLKYELFPDFNVGITFTDTFDSSPPDPSTQKNDFVTSLTIGWSYRR
jgi:hypothetical protein